MANVDITIKAIDQTKAGFSSAKQSVGGLSNEVALGIGKFEVYSQIIEKVGKTLADMVNDTVDYASEVRNLTQITGLSAEESSRLIQVSDDLKISTEDLTKAQKKLASDGLSLSIETLSRLSDQYRAIQDPAAKATFLTDTFGKSGYKFAEAMQKGGDALKEMNDGISDNLVLTQDAVDAAREYEKNIDDLQDSFMELKVSIGNGVIPILNEVMDGMQNQNAIREKANQLMRDGIAKNREEALTLAEKSIKIAEFTQGLDSAGLSYRAIAESIVVADDATQGFSLSYEKQLDLVGDFTNSLQTQSEKLDEIKEKYGEGSQEYSDATAQFEEDGRRRILSMLEQQLSMDGLTQQEMDLLLAKGLAWGVYSEQAVEASRKAMEEVAALTDAINTIPSERTFTMSVMVQGADAVGGLGAGFGSEQWGGGKALGGSVSAGTSYLVGEHGPERFTPSTNGTITPNSAGADSRIIALLETIAAKPAINEYILGQVVKESISQVIR